MPQAVAGTLRKIHAEPTKDFFVNMITRDIALEDCIFDLLDNSIDGARRMRGPDCESFAGFEVRLDFDSKRFVVEDNCGGILLSDAIDYAFHFGRRHDQQTDVAGGIGLYGIGMKRAIFKMGRDVVVTSHAKDASFTVSVDVDEWAKRPEWDFEYQDTAVSEGKGTRIEIRRLNAGIESSLGDAVFRNRLSKLIARDYSFFVAKGLRILVAGHAVPSLSYQLRANNDLAPAIEEYEDDGVRVRIVAGLIDGLSDDIPDEIRPSDVERYGWYVVCNERVVLAADKSTETIWGHDGFFLWHPQYNGFAGFLFFSADDQRKLPWTTTKRELDSSSSLYRRSLARLKVITTEFVQYTNRRKSDVEAAKSAERPSGQLNVFDQIRPQALRLPKLGVAVAGPQMANILYKRKLEEVAMIRKHLNHQTLTYREIGEMTFDYFLKMELGK
jgi:hypothetical protein